MLYNKVPIFITNYPKCNNNTVLYNPCFLVHLLTGRSEHCVGYKAAPVDLQQSQCLAQGHCSKISACSGAGADL